MFTGPVEVRAPSRQRRGSGPIHRSGPERHFPCSPDPFQAPRSPAGPPRPAEPSETTGQAKFLREDAFRGGIGLLEIRSGWGWGLWPPVRQRGMDYLRVRHVTPYYYKKVIATGVMTHDRLSGLRTLPGRPTGQVAGAQRQGFQVWRSNARQIAPAPDAGAWSDGPAVRFGLREPKILTP